VVEDTGKAAVQAALEATMAMEQMVAASAQAFNDTYGGTGTMQSSMDDFFAHMANLNRQATEAAKAYNDSFYEANKDIWDLLYKSQQEVIVGVDAVNNYYKAMENSADAARKKIDQIATAVKNVTTGTETMAWWGGEASKSYSNTLKVAENLLAANQHLGAERLEPLRNAIADAKNRMLDLRAAAGDTLGVIQDEWDQLKAQAMNDGAAVADLTRAQTLLKQINDANITEAKTRENTNKPAPAATSPTAHRVSITINGRAQTINAASASDASNLAALFRDLETTMNRSA